VVAANQVRASGRAGIRVDDYQGRRGVVQVAQPLLMDNVVESNTVDDVQRGRYTE
jgi:hypothetical protein